MPNNPPKNNTPDKALAPTAWLYEKNGKQSLQFERQPWLTSADRGWAETALFSQPQHGGLVEACRKAHDTLIELNPSNYTHDDVCEANDAAVEAILILADALGEWHGKTAKWWAERRAALASNSPVVGEDAPAIPAGMKPSNV